MKAARAGIGLALLAGGLLGPPAAAAVDTAPEIDPRASRAAITVDLRVGGRVQGRFQDFDGQLLRHPDGQLQVQVRLDASRLVLEGPGWMDRSMRSEKFLDVARHPVIRFRSEPFAPGLSREGGWMAGELELRGVSRPVRFQVAPAACEAPGLDCDIHVSGVVSRREFGMVAYRVWLQDGVGFDFRVRLRQSGRP
ncbi:YceI family protein [Arenimonas sp.]|uniref:YceI family protein n=1 Tax=Arenimonas sp. TaxID=1872635 RepID=UPI0035B09860